MRISEDSHAPIVLDTHVWMWLTNGDPKLGAKARIWIDETGDSGGELLVSAISVWEIAMLEAAGKIKLDGSVDKWITRALQLSGVDISPLIPAIAIDSCNLPGNFHGDPADRIILATARCRKCHLVNKRREDSCIRYAGTCTRN